MKVALISSRFPYANNEPFLGAEIAALAPHIERLTVAPLRPSGKPLHDTAGAVPIVQWPWTFSTLRLACSALRRAPRESIGALSEILRGSGGLYVKLKNLVVYPRALALAERFRQEGVEHVHAYWLSTPATAAMIVARVNAISWSSTAHRWDVFERNMIPEKAASARFIRTISERARTEIMRIAPSRRKKIIVVRLGTAILQSAAPPRGARSGLSLLCAAALRPVKGHADLCEAFAVAHAADPSLRLTLCGEGALEAEIRARIEALPCRDAIHFRGYVAHDRLLSELASGRYDAVVLASRDDGVREMEGVPSILIEASSLNVACIATRSGAVGELLDDRSAFLVPPQQPALLADAILNARDPQQRRTRVALAAKRARELHDPYRTAEQIAALLAESA